VKEFGKILGYFVGVLISGALLAPPLYWAGQALVASGYGAVLAKYGFQKYFNRGVLLAALVWVGPCLRWLRVEKRDLEWLRSDPRWAWRLAVGFGLGTIALAALAGGYSVAGLWEWRAPFSGRIFGKALLSAGVVAGMEEVLFRGGLHSIFRRSLTEGRALWATSALFAVVHFLKPNPALRWETVDWTSGFRLIPEAFHQFADPLLVLGGWVTLLVFGALLGWTVQRTGSLWMSVGLHAGVVWVKLSFEKMAFCKGSFLPWMGAQLPVGLVPVLVLLALWGAVALGVLKGGSPVGPQPEERP
jgi:membrane protease YdiL (CAAX protease family)